MWKTFENIGTRWISGGFFLWAMCIFGGFLIDFCWGCGIFRDIRRRGLLQAGAKVVLWSALTGTTTMGHLHMPRASAGKIDLLIY